MRFLDDLIVGTATRLIRFVMAIGTGLVYVQAVGLVLLVGAAVVVLGGMLLRAAAAGIGG